MLLYRMYSRYNATVLAYGQTGSGKSFTMQEDPDHIGLVIQRGKRVTSLGFFLRVIVNQKPLNLEKTTSSVLSVLLLIYGSANQNQCKKVTGKKVSKKNLEIKTFVKSPNFLKSYVKMSLEIKS